MQNYVKDCEAIEYYGKRKYTGCFFFRMNDDQEVKGMIKTERAFLKKKNLNDKKQRDQTTGNQEGKYT